jgi:hypothetical protein
MWPGEMQLRGRRAVRPIGGFQRGLALAMGQLVNNVNPDRVSKPSAFATVGAITPSTTIGLPVSGPAGALKIAQPAMRLGRGERARGKLAREDALTVEKEMQQCGGGRRSAGDLRVDPRVILAHAPETLNVHSCQLSTVLAGLQGDR